MSLHNRILAGRSLLLARNVASTLPYPSTIQKAAANNHVPIKIIRSTIFVTSRPTPPVLATTLAVQTLAARPLSTLSMRLRFCPKKMYCSSPTAKLSAGAMKLFWITLRIAKAYVWPTLWMCTHALRDMFRTPFLRAMLDAASPPGIRDLWKHLEQNATRFSSVWALREPKTATASINGSCLHRSQDTIRIRCV